MKKKLSIAFVLFFSVVVVSFAQLEVVHFNYIANFSDEAFKEYASKGIRAVLENAREGRGFVSGGLIDRLPNDVIQAINNELLNYDLKDGDNFIAFLGRFRTYYNAEQYCVWLRLTNARNRQWDFYASLIHISAF